MKGRENGKIKLIVTDLELPSGGCITDSSFYSGDGSYFVNDGIAYNFVTVNNGCVTAILIHPNAIRETFQSK